MLAQAGGLVGDIDFYGIKARAEFAGDSRVSGTIGGPNPAAAYLAMMMAVALGLILSGARRRDKYIGGHWLGDGHRTIGIYVVQGGWLCFLVGVATVIGFGRRRVPWKTAGVSIILLVLLVVPFNGAIGERLYGDDNGSVAGRMPLNKLAGGMIADHPLLGVGVNNFALAMEPYLARYFSGDFLYTVHNTYLLVWAETGIGGLIAFVWLLIAILRQGSACWRLLDPLFAPLALGCAAAVTGFLVQMSFDPYRSGAAIDLLWLIAGLVTAMNRESVGAMIVPQPGGTTTRERMSFKVACQ